MAASTLSDELPALLLSLPSVSVGSLPARRAGGVVSSSSAGVPRFALDWRTSQPAWTAVRSQWGPTTDGRTWRASAHGESSDTRRPRRQYTHTQRQCPPWRPRWGPGVPLRRVRCRVHAARGCLPADQSARRQEAWRTKPTPAISGEARNQSGRGGAADWTRWRSTATANEGPLLRLEPDAAPDQPRYRCHHLREGGGGPDIRQQLACLHVGMLWRVTDVPAGRTPANQAVHADCSEALAWWLTLLLLFTDIGHSG